MIYNQKQAKNPKTFFRRVIAKQRRKAAIHEAGHIVVAWHLGYKADGHILLNEEHHELEEGEILESADKSWLGEMKLYDPVYDEEDNFKIGIARVLAEILRRDGDLVQLQDSMVLEDIVEGMSPSDRKRAGIKEFKEYENKFLETEPLIHDLWSNIVKMSSILICEWKKKEKNRKGRDEILESMAR